MNAGWILLFLLLIIGIIIFIKYQKNNVVYITSELDHQPYLVRDLNDKQYASNMLAKIKQNIIIITNYLFTNKDKYPDYIEYINQLNTRIKNVEVLESTEDSVYTSYSVNKGEQIVFCLRSRNIRNKLHEFNLLMYVVIHEMSHVACPEYGHTPLFKKIFAFLIQESINIGMYKRMDFANEPEEYCGMMITESIL